MKTPARLKNWITEKLFQVVRAYFSGRKVHWMSLLDGQPIHRAEGAVISAVISRGSAGEPIGLSFAWLLPGRPLRELRRFPLRAISYDKQLGWVFYD